MMNIEDNSSNSIAPEIHCIDDNDSELSILKSKFWRKKNN